jgi:MFS family permease
MKYRFLANGGIYFMTFPFTVFGPAVSLSLGNNPNLGWRWVFYIMIIVNGVCTICWAVFYHPPTFHMLHRNERVKSVLKKFDYVGFVLFAGGVCVFILGMSWGGSIYRKHPASWIPSNSILIKGRQLGKVPTSLQQSLSEL